MWSGRYLTGPCLGFGRSREEKVFVVLCSQLRFDASWPIYRPTLKDLSPANPHPLQTTQLSSVSQHDLNFFENNLIQFSIVRPTMGERATESRITRPIDVLSAALQVGAFAGVFHLSFFYHLNPV